MTQNFAPTPSPQRAPARRKSGFAAEGQLARGRTPYGASLSLGSVLHHRLPPDTPSRVVTAPRAIRFPIPWVSPWPSPPFPASCPFRFSRFWFHSPPLAPDWTWCSRLAPLSRRCGIPSVGAPRGLSSHHFTSCSALMPSAPSPSGPRCPAEKTITRRQAAAASVSRKTRAAGGRCWRAS